MLRQRTPSRGCRRVLRPACPGRGRRIAQESPRLCRHRAAIRRYRHPGLHLRSRRDGRNTKPGMILQLHATPEEVMRAVEAIQDFARNLALDEKSIFGLALALEECGS